MKKIISFTFALISPAIFATQSSIFKITALTATEHNELEAFCEETQNCGEYNFIKTDKGIFSFHIDEPIVNTKIGQCIQIFHTSDKIEKNFVNRGILNSKIVDCNIKSNKASLPKVDIISTASLNHEAVGLKVIDFKYNSKKYSYRVYCPNFTVRNISNNKIGKARTSDEEDKITFSGKNVINQIAEKICD